MACVRLSRMTGFVRKLRKKFSAEMGSNIACGTSSLCYKVIGVAPKSAAHLSCISAGVWKEFMMPQAKQTSKLKRRSKALPVLGAAGLSLSLASAASAVPSGLGDMPTPKTGTDNTDVNDNTHVSLAPFYAFDKESEGTGVTLGEEEISDVSLATFYV